ncbi:hypothetical protein G6F37_007748 [Rhizopus arrhizus]|nr:hypothetical protein G6F37_007748 [Rhizopus arrhizus]
MKVQTTTSEGSSLGNPVLSNPIPVSDGIENDKSKTDDVSSIQALAIGRLEIIKATMEKQNLDATTISHFQHKHRKETIDKVTGVTLVSRLPKKAQQKTITLGIANTSDLCPVTTPYFFIHQTKRYRGNLPEHQTLFLVYIDNDQHMTISVSLNTVISWIKSDMAQAGIDTTKHQPHSIRSAASTKTIQLGFKVEEVKKHANWSLNSNTFEKYYYKPNNTDRISTTIGNSMINSLSENITISGVRTEATRSRVGTSHNSRYKVLPIVLVVAINGFTNIALEKEFSTLFTRT